MKLVITSIYWDMTIYIKSPTKESVDDMSQARITASEGMTKTCWKKVVDASWIDMLINSDKVNEVELSKHVDTNATIS